MCHGLAALLRPFPPVGQSEVVSFRVSESHKETAGESQRTKVGTPSAVFGVAGQGSSTHKGRPWCAGSSLETAGGHPPFTAIWL
jgi:hypothetical protein